MRIDYGLIGKRISTRRKTRKRTQEDLAEHLAVSVGYISQIERGVTKVNLETLSEIAIYLGCDVTELLAGTTPTGDWYLDEELALLFGKLNAIQKRMLLEIAELFLKYN